MPNPGLYVLVANYYQPDNAAFGLDLNITTVPEGAEAVDVEEQGCNSIDILDSLDSRLNQSLNRCLPKHVLNPCLKLRLNSSLKFQMSIELHPRCS